MAKSYLFMMLTLDGYFEGPDHDISWHNTDGEFTQFANTQLDSTSALVLGRRTFELFEAFWPSAEARQLEPDTAVRMTDLPKHVFTHAGRTTSWDHTEFHSEDELRTVIADLKATSSNDIGVLASSNLCVSLLREGLLDELRLMYNPVAIGSGTSLFNGLENKLPLELATSRTFGNGNVLSTYEVNIKMVES